VRWAGHVVCMGERRCAYRVLVGKPEGKNHLGDQGVDGRIILRWIFRKWEGEHGLDSSDSGQGQGFVNVVTNLQVPYNMWNFLTS